MKNVITKSTFLGIFMAVVLASCGKDQPIANENSEVTTNNKGQVYEIDTLNSRIEWKGYKVVKSNQSSHFGTIKFESGDLTVHQGVLESGNFVVDMNSLTSVDLKDDPEQLAKLNGHLKSGDFFETDQFPTASYEITKVSKNITGDYNSLLDGNLTIKGITKPIQFMANVMIKSGETSIATEPKDISREGFNVNFQMPLADGIVKDDINVQILIKATEKK